MIIIDFVDTMMSYVRKLTRQRRVACLVFDGDGLRTSNAVRQNLFRYRQQKFMLGCEMLHSAELQRNSSELEKLARSWVYFTSRYKNIIMEVSISIVHTGCHTTIIIIYGSATLFSLLVGGIYVTGQ